MKKEKKHKKNTSKYLQLSSSERLEIEILRNKSYSLKDIAQALKRNKSTISREIARNRRRKRIKGGKRFGLYEAKTAIHKTKLRRADSKYQGKKINENKELKEYIIKGLKEHWSPDEISGRMSYENKPFYASKTAVYSWLYSAWGQKHTHLLYSKRSKPRKQKQNKKKKEMIPNRVGIGKRGREADLRLEYGHFETDTVVSGRKTRSKVSLSVMYERKARYTSIKRINSLKPRQNNSAIIYMSKELKVFKTLTLDNGIENTRHRELQKELDIKTFFCDPYSSWQKGGVENTNKMIRRYIPKGSNISNYSQEYIDSVCHVLNNKPRKSLGYRTPLEVMVQNDLLKKLENQNQPLGSGWQKVKKIIKLKLKKHLLGVALGG